jgi:LemA protein
LNLQRQLSNVEDALQKSRRYYNGTVRDYNITVQSFPTMIFAGWFNFHSEPFFQLEHEDERAVPAVHLER